MENRCVSLVGGMVARSPRLSLLTIALILVLRDQGKSYRQIVQNRRVRKKDGSKLSQQARVGG